MTEYLDTGLWGMFSDLVFLRSKDDLPEYSTDVVSFDTCLLARAVKGKSLRRYNRITERLSLMWDGVYYRVYEDTYCVVTTNDSTVVLRTLNVLHTTTPFLAFSREKKYPKRRRPYEQWIPCKYGLIGIGRTDRIEELERDYVLTTMVCLPSYQRMLRIHLLAGYGDTCAELHYDGIRSMLSYDNIASRIHAWERAWNKQEEEFLCR